MTDEIGTLPKLNPETGNYEVVFFNSVHKFRAEKEANDYMQECINWMFEDPIDFGENEDNV